MANYKNITVNIATGDLQAVPTAEQLLRETDWTQLPDSGLTTDCVAAFATYRASIRTIRKSNPKKPTWPNVPDEEWS
tara:strand:+ start:288 stop:518 length:231 start_codon:yes stop_codon:yes gene_type:complete